MTYQLTEEVSDTAIGDIRNNGVEEERPGHRIQQCLFHLIKLEMLISNTLLVNSDTSDRQHAVLLLQPPRVQLVIRHNPQEHDAQTNRQQPSHQEDNLPRLNRRAVLGCADRNAVGNHTTENLADAIEAEPDVDSDALFVFGVPLSVVSMDARL